MRTEFADIQVANFQRAFSQIHKRELDSGLKREYRLYCRVLAGGDQIVFVPPDAAHLAEATPTWGKQLKPLAASPNLTGCSELKFK